MVQSDKYYKYHAVVLRLKLVYYWPRFFRAVYLLLSVLEKHSVFYTSAIPEVRWYEPLYNKCNSQYVFDSSMLLLLNVLTVIIIIIMSCCQHGYPWPSLATSPYHSSPPAGLQGYILCPHIVAVCKFELVFLLLHGHMWGSIGVHHLWARPCFSSSVPRVWFV